jgi:hypothetical protein
MQDKPAMNFVPVRRVEVHNTSLATYALKRWYSGLDVFVVGDNYSWFFKSYPKLRLLMMFINFSFSFLIHSGSPQFIIVMFTLYILPSIFYNVFNWNMETTLPNFPQIKISRCLTWRSRGGLDLTWEMSSTPLPQEMHSINCSDH